LGVVLEAIRSALAALTGGNIAARCPYHFALAGFLCLHLAAWQLCAFALNSNCLTTAKRRRAGAHQNTKINRSLLPTDTPR
jgi:hypothetical protein